MTDQLPEPSACATCDQPKTAHGYSGVPGHRYRAPGVQLIRHRMSKRRAVRMAAATTPARGHHLSDCAVHGAPAQAAMPCDCAGRA